MPTHMMHSYILYNLVVSCLASVMKFASRIIKNVYVVSSVYWYLVFIILFYSVRSAYVVFSNSRKMISLLNLLCLIFLFSLYFVPFSFKEVQLHIWNTKLALASWKCFERKAYWFGLLVSRVLLIFLPSFICCTIHLIWNIWLVF